MQLISLLSTNKVYDSRGGCNAIIESASDRLVQACARTKIPEGVKVIGRNAFKGVEKGCVDIPSSVVEIENGAFFGCGLRGTLVIPGSVKSIGKYAFTACRGIDSLVVEEGCERIAASAFSLCRGLRHAKLPSTLKEFGSGSEYVLVFDGCSLLEEIELPNENPSYYCNGDVIIEKSTLAVVAGCGLGHCQINKGLGGHQPKKISKGAFCGMTSCEEEVELRRCLMHDDLAADMSLERECLLAMLQPNEYDCSEEMSAVSAMIDNFAAKETATIQQRKASRRVVLRSLGSIVAVAAAAQLFFLFFPYSNETVQDDKELLATACVNENGAYESVIENYYVNSVAQNQVAVDEIQPAAIDKEVHLYSRLDETAVHKITENRVEPEAATCERFIGNILSEPPVAPSSVAAIVNSEKNAALYLLNLYSIMEYLRYMHGNDASSNFAYIAKSVGKMATGRPHALHIEKLIDSKAGSGSFDAIWRLEENSIEFAPDDVPWNPATPLRVYSIQSKNRETIVTFLYSICFDSQYVGLSSRAYAVDDENGDVYDVIGYSKGFPMDKRLVVNGCKGRNILISLRFPKFKRRVKSITIHDPEQKSGVLQFCDSPLATAIVSGVNVKKFKK